MKKNDMPESLRDKVKSIVQLLVAGNYQEIERLTGGRRLTGAEIALVVREYGRLLIPPPEDAYDHLDVVQVQDAVPAEWSVWTPLWTREEGRSDLGLQLTLRQINGDLQVEVDDIHVL